MKRFILGFMVFLFTAASCFAAWNETENDKEAENFWKKPNRQFFIPKEKAKKGFKIVAMYPMSKGDLLDAVALRYLDNKVDYDVSLFEPLHNSSCAIYIDLLDDDEFLIKSIFIRNVDKLYEGTLYGNFEMNWATFERIKHYRLSVKT